VPGLPRSGTAGGACRRCRTASWWRRIKISAVYHAFSRRDSRSHVVTRVMRRKANCRHMIGDHHGRARGEQLCWSEPWMRFSARTASPASRVRVTRPCSTKSATTAARQGRAGAGPASPVPARTRSVQRTDRTLPRLHQHAPLLRGQVGSPRGHAGPAIGGGEDLASAAPKPWVSDLTVGQVPCAAPRLVPHVAQQRAGRRARMRHGATLRLSGAAHQRAQRRTDTIRRSAPSPRAELTVSERAALASRRGSWEPIGPPGRPARLDHLQMRQQSLAEMAPQEGRVVTRWQESPDRRGRDLPR
jgi:hypothetical protein